MKNFLWSFTETYTAEQDLVIETVESEALIETNTVIDDPTGRIFYEPSKRAGQHLLVYNNFRYFRNRKRGPKQYWKCSFYYKTKCPAIMIVNEESGTCQTHNEHQHNTVVTLLSPIEAV